MLWWWPSVRPSVRPVSVRLSISPSQFSVLFSFMLWDIEQKFYVSLYFMHVRLKFNAINFRQFLQELWPFWIQTYTNMQFSTLFFYMPWYIEFKFCVWLCFNVLKIMFEYCHFASILSLELCLFFNLEYWKCIVFLTFLLHAFTYSAENLHMTLL